MLRRLILVIALIGSFALVGSMADAATTSEATSAVAESERARTCEKRVAGVLRHIYDREDMSCRKAKQIMTRWLLRKHLARKWRCQGQASSSFGRCIDTTDFQSGFSWKSRARN